MIPSLFCETPLIMAQVDQNMLQVKNGWGVSNSSVLWLIYMSVNKNTVVQ